VAEAFAPLAGADAGEPIREPRRPAARPRSGKPDDDEDFGNDQIFGRDDDF
jgi:hypothetical protein